MKKGGEDVAQVGQFEADDLGAHAAVEQEDVKQVGQRDQQRRDVAKDADLFCELAKPEFERAVALFQLHFPADLSEEGCVPDRCDGHFAAACGQVTAPEEGIGAAWLEGVCVRARDGTRPRLLFDFATFAGHSGLVDPCAAPDQDPVSRNAFARRQQHAVSHDHLRDGDFPHAARATDPAGCAVSLLGKSRERPLGGPLGEGGDQGGEEDGKPDAGSLDPIRAVEQEQQVDRQRRQQDADDRVVQIGQKLPPERFCLLPGKLVAAVCRPRRPDLLVGQPSGLLRLLKLLDHCFTPK